MEYLDSHKSDAWIKTKDFLTESSIANGKFSTETLVGEFIPGVTEKYEFDYRDKSIILLFFEFSDYRDYDGEKKIDTSSIKQFTTSGKHPNET